MAETIKAFETIDLLYRAALEPGLWPEALDRLAHACGGIGTAMIPITPGDTSGLIVSPALEEANVEYEREWWRHDTRVLRISSRQLTDGVCCEAELFTSDEIARDPLRQEFLRSWGIGAFAAHLVAPLPHFVVAFSVQRALKAGHFEKHDLQTLDLLGRHAARALVISTRLAAAGALEQSLEKALAQLDCGALLLDRELRIVLANDAVNEMLEDGLLISQGYLHASCREQQTALTKFVRSVLDHSADCVAAPIALARPSGRRPLLLQAIPIASTVADLAARTGAVVLLIVVNPDRDNRNCRNMIEQLRLLGLTRAEARVAALIGVGHSREEAAEALGLSKSTVNDTVKQTYSKLDVSRQSELVRLIDRLAALKSPCEPHDGRNVVSE